MRWHSALACAWALPVGFLAWLYFQDLVTIERQVVDLPALIGIPGTSGMVSGVGIALWYVAGSVCWFAAGLQHDREKRVGLRLIGTLSVWLGLDDEFMLHEEVLPQLFGLSPSVMQPLLYCLYGLLLLGCLRRLPELWHSEENRTFFASLFCLGASIAVDVLKDSGRFPPRSRMALDEGFAMWVEESLKLLGIVAWTLFWWRWSASSLSKSGSSSDSAS